MKLKCTGAILTSAPSWSHAALATTVWDTNLDGKTHCHQLLPLPDGTYHSGATPPPTPPAPIFSNQEKLFKMEKLFCSQEKSQRST